MHIFYIIYGVILVIALLLSHNVIYYGTYITHTMSEYELSGNRLLATFLCFMWPAVVVVGLFAAVGFVLCETICLPAKLVAKKKGLLK